MNMRRSAKTMVIAAILAISAGMAAAQTGTDEPESGSPNARTEIVVAYSTMEIEFNPHYSIYAHEAQFFTAVYEGLFTYNPSTLEPVRSAAQRFSKSQDGRIYTFYLRKDAKWSNGDRVTASNFRDAWLAMIAPEAKTDYGAFFDVIAGAREYRLGTLKDATSVGISVIADDVLQVKLVNPTPYFTRLLCHHSFAPIHQSMLGKRDWSAKPTTIPTNGPYAITVRNDSELVLEKSASYWDAESVKVPRIRIVFIEDSKESTARYNGGEVDWLAGAMDLDTLAANDSLQVNPMFATHYWYFSCDAAPWTIPEVRRALQLLVPWKTVRDADLYFAPAKGLLLPLEGYRGAKAIDRQDAAAAKELLTKAGFPDGAGLPPITIVVPDGEDSQRIAGILKTAWESGIQANVTIEALSDQRFYSAVKTKPYTVSLTSWIGDFADPLAFLQMWTSDSGLNSAKYRDPAYDALIAKSMTEGAEERLATLANAEKELMNSGAVMPIYHQLAVNVVDTEAVRGWYRNALDIHPFKYFEFGQRKASSNVAMMR